MIRGLENFLLARTPRERWLLAILLVIGMPLGWYQGVIVPLEQREAAARQALLESRALERWLEAQRAELAALPVAVETEELPLPGLGAIDARLQAAGLDAALSTATGGGVSVVLEDAEYVVLMPWLELFERETGYVLAQLSLRRGDLPGQVRAELVLRPE
ncbi:MAG: type II secretion system protein GspM [Roseinatronobacter sp.]